MKNLFAAIKYVVILFCVIACNFTEDLYVNEDGTGKISINFDGSELMKMGGDKISEGKEEVIDSTIVFKDFLEEKKDSISKLPIEEQEKLKRLENFKMHMVMNTVSKEMSFDLYSEFKNVSELGDVFNDFKTASAVGNSGKGNAAGQNASMPMASSETEGSRVNYSFKDNIFKRTTEILDEELVKKSLDSIKQMEMFLANSKYTLKYHFPKKIKKISADKALFSQDGKTFTLEVGFMEYMKNPKILDVEVELEK